MIRYLQLYKSFFLFLVPSSRDGGSASERVVTPPDWVLDYWHPLEKAHYPEYFKTREARKCEYIQKWHLGTLY